MISRIRNKSIKILMKRDWKMIEDIQKVIKLVIGTGQNQ